MPDIKMCWGKGCPIKEKCYRYTAMPDTSQSYFEIDLPMGDPISGNCSYFWPEKEPKRVYPKEPSNYDLKVVQ